MANPGKWMYDRIAAHMRRPSDTEEQVHLKVASFLLAMVVIIAITMILIAGRDQPWLFMTTVQVMLPVTVGLAVLVWCKREASRAYVLCFVAVVLVGIAVSDLDNASRTDVHNRMWWCVILPLDYLIMVGVDTRTVQLAIVGGVVVWVTIIEVETAYRFGLFDLDGLQPYAKRQTMCDCARPPCPTHGESMSTFTSAVTLLGACLRPTMVFVVDHLITQGYASRLVKQKQRLQAAVDTTQKVAEALVHYDLDAARKVLSGDDSVPPELLAHLHTLLANLGSYRPYLPPECFLHSVAGSDSGPFKSVSDSTNDDVQNPLALLSQDIPKSGDGGRVAIVVTSVYQSGVLWEHCSSAMHSALMLHNGMIRTALYQHGGHEIKTFGDFFLLAFEGAAKAVQFGMAVLQSAQDEDWPEGLRRPGAEADGFPVLCLKIGVDYGPVVVERSTLTGRTEIFGLAVTRAGRTEQVGLPCTTTVTVGVLEAMPGFLHDPHCIVIPHDQSEESSMHALQVWALLPTALQEQESLIRDNLGKLQGGGDTASVDQALSDVFLEGSQRDFCESGDELVGEDGELTVHPPANIRERTARQSATIGFLQYGCTGEAVPSSWEAAEHSLTQRLELLQFHLEATNGRIATVVHDLVLLSWGIHGRCTQHVNESARFLLRLHSSRAEDNISNAGNLGASFHAGIATGSVACCVVTPSPTQCHVTILGPSVGIALALCTGSAEVGAAVLVASLQVGSADRYDSNEFLRRHLWPIDQWNLQGIGEGTAPVTVYALNLAKAAQEVEEVDRQGKEVDALSRDEAHEKFLTAFARRDVVGIRAVAAGYPPAAFAEKCMLDKGHLPHLLASRTPRQAPRQAVAPVTPRGARYRVEDLTVSRLRNEDEHMPLSTAQVLEAMGSSL